MNAGQLKKYWWLFGPVRAYYAGLGYTAEEIEARRKAIHRKALGFEKSATVLTNDDFNALKKAFRAVWDGSNFDAQLGFIEDEATQRHRLLLRIETLGEACGIEHGIAGILAYFKKWAGGRVFDKLTNAELHQLRALLERRAKQLKKKQDAENPY